VAGAVPASIRAKVSSIALPALSKFRLPRPGCRPLVNCLG
jgi:hypothetical protein